MDWQTLWNDGPVISGHALAALGAMALGGVQLAAPKGSRTHRALGWIWVAAMASVALSSFWIHEFRILGPFSPIHLLSLFTLFAIWRAVGHARRGDVASHRLAMAQLYGLALILTGAFTLLPGRTMHGVIFGG